MRVGIIGAGLIGNKRAKAIMACGDKVVKVNDLDKNKSKLLTESIKNCKSVDSNNIFRDLKIDTVVISTTHNSLAELTYKALSNNKHVLTEKPLGINVKNVQKCVDLAAKKNLVFKSGFNHRFHPAVYKAKQLYDKGVIGKLMHIRGVYGHGGRPGYEKEWRMNKNISGGGELIDQCAHLIDLSLWFMKSKPTKVLAKIKTSFWPIKVEDNAFVILDNKSSVATLHASWTEWKNKFRFEIFGTKGYLIIDGLGGSYGCEKLYIGKRVPGKAPKEKLIQFEDEDRSWLYEWKNFKRSIKNHNILIGSGEEGLEVLKIITKIYNNQK